MEFDNSFDYFSLMMEFARKNPRYNSDHWDWSCKNYGESLVELNRQLSTHKDSNFMNFYWFRWLVGDIIISNKVVDDLKSLKSKIVKGGTLQDNWIFLTLNFNDTEPISANKMLHFAQEICKKSWVAKADFVLEKHRVNGIHHHFHMLIDLGEEIRKGKIIELVYKIAGLKKYCAGKQYVDVKTKKDPRAEREVYYKYVRGDKKDEKQYYVQKDVVWRAQHSVQDLYEYVKS